MRILLDNSVPRALRHFLKGHTVVTSVELRWERLKNGKLLSAAEEAGFDLFLTCDQAMKSEQNLTGRFTAILALGSNFWLVLKARGTEIAMACTALDLNPNLESVGIEHLLNTRG